MIDAAPTRDLRLTRNVRLLVAARTARSVGQGVTVASFTLYLHALGYGGAAIGSVLMAGLSFGILLTLVVGPLSDRRGRRGLLLGYETAAAPTAPPAPFPRSSRHGWRAKSTARRYAFSLNATLGFLGMAIGAALVALPPLFGYRYAHLDNYRLLFLVPFTGSIAAMAMIGCAREPPTLAAGVPDPAVLHAAAPLTRRENHQLRRLAFTNAINGLAIGIIGPLMAYWFARRFGERPALIGPALAASFLLASFGAVLSGKLSVRFGAVRSVVWMRLIGLVMLFATPFAPVFGAAVALYALRAAFNQGTAGARQAVAAGLTRPERRGLAASVQNMSTQIPRATGPVLGGWLIHLGGFTAPFLIATALQALYLYLYRHYFGELDAAAD